MSTVSRRAVAWVLVGGGAASLLASFALTVEHIRLLQNPDYVPACNLNPLVSCTSVMTTAQGNLLGFPNSLAGIAGFSVLVTFGVLILAGVRLPAWIWRSMVISLAAAAVFVHWLFAESVYRIGSLCPYCIATWISVITMFWYLLLHAIETGLVPVSPRLRGTARLAISMHSTGLVMWFIILGGLAGLKLWT